MHALARARALAHTQTRDGINLKTVGPRIHRHYICAKLIEFAKSKEWFWGRNTVQERQSRMKLAIIAEGFEPSRFNPKPDGPTVTVLDAIREALDFLHVKGATFIYCHL